MLRRECREKRKSDYKVEGLLYLEVIPLGVGWWARVRRGGELLCCREYLVSMKAAIA